jgi:hypothetical protein
MTHQEVVIPTGRAWAQELGYPEDEFARRKAAKLGAMGSTIRATEPGRRGPV